MTSINKISVIVPIYNTELYLCKCIDSICNQTYKCLEIILVDNGCTDRCSEICDIYADKNEQIRVLHFDCNRGVGPALNAGLDIATGDWIVFVDSDDWIDPDMCEGLLAEALHHRADIVICAFYYQYADHQEIGCPDWKKREQLKTEEIVERLLRDERYNSYWGKLWKADLFRELRFPNEKRFADAALAYRILEKVRRGILIPEAKYHYVQRDQSIMRTCTLKNPVNLFQIYEKRFSYMQKQWPQFYPLLKEQCITYSTTIWRNYYKYPKEERRSYQTQLTQIAVFMKDNYQTSPQYLNGGAGKKILLWSTQYARWWSFMLVAVLNYAYTLEIRSGFAIREFVEKCLPKGTLRRKVCKRVYSIVRPQRSSC